MGANAYPSQDDRDLIAFIEPRLKHKWEVINAESLEQWLSVIESSTVLVSGRFHHSLAAYCLGTPFIALNSNTPKIEGLMQRLKLNEVINYNNPDLTKILLASTDFAIKQSPLYDLSDLCASAMLNFMYLPTAAKTLDDTTEWQDYVTNTSELKVDAQGASYHDEL
jgi:polysaccharide pyruvyl transferase WcaK-like protein